MTTPRHASAGRTGVEIDQIGFDILRVLRDNGRISIAALAEEVGISRAGAYSRVESLTKAGVITGYSAEVDAGRLGLGVSSLVFCTIDPQSWGPFLEAVGDIPDIESVLVTTGEHDVMMHVRSADVAAVHTLIVGPITSLPGVTRVVTVMVLSEVLRRPYVLPDEVPVREPLSVGAGLLRYTPTSTGRPGAS